jgi:hypothetical protein
VNIRSSSIEQKGDGKRGIKASGMLMVNGVLYLLARNAGNSQLAWSSDHGATWTWADWKCTESLGCPTFLNFGRNYAGARDGFVYVYSPDTDSAYERADRMVLARVPKDSLRDDDAYEFFERLDAAGQPVWTKDIAQRGAVLKHCGRCYRSGVTYNAPLHRYLWCVTMPVEDKRLAGGLTIYDAPEPWGPWTVAFTTEAWDVAPGESASFPTKWMSADGRTMHLVFSGNDSFSVRKSTLVANSTNAPAAGTAPQLRVSDNHRYLVDQQGRPFFLLADTPWFLQKLPIEDVRRVLDDRKAKGFNALFLELLDDSRIKSVDGYGAVAFEPPTDITKPAEAYWRYAEQVVEEAERRGLFVIHNSIWFGAGKGLWMHHVTPENCRVYGDFIARRFARFKNLMWMHVGDRNPDARLVACARELAAAVRRHAPHQLQTTHLQPQFASATHFNQDDWLNVNMAYTYGVAYLHVLPEYQRGNPVRPVILGETGYEGEPNSIHLLPDAKKGDLWNPYRIRRNAWWAALSGACGYCAGTRLWRWEPNWREVLNAKSSQQAPLIRWLFEPRPWWRLVPDEKHELVTAGYGTWKQPDYATAAFADDGSLAVVYVPSPRTLTVNLGKLMARVRASWFDPTSGELKTVAGGPFANRGLHEFAAPGRNSDGDGDGDWVLVLEPSR